MHPVAVEEHKRVLSEYVQCDDNCPARATTTVALQSLVLTFCGHHYAKHEVALLTNGWSAYDGPKPS